MFTGFQLDPSSPRLPLGVRIVVSLTAEGEEPFTLAITPIGVIQNYRFPAEILNEENIHPYPRDVINVQYTPGSLAQRHIIQLPEDQRLLIGNLPGTFSFDIFVERQFDSQWRTTNRVLAVTDGHEFSLFQAKEYTKPYVPAPIVIARAKPVAALEPEIIYEEIDEPELPTVDETEPEVVAAPEVVIDEPTVAIDLVEFDEPEPGITTKESPVETSVATNVAPIFHDTESAGDVGIRNYLQNLLKREFLRTARKRVIVVVDVIVILFGIFLFTPLSLVHPDQPDKNASSVVITWPAHSPSLGQQVVTAMVDEAGAAYIFLGSVENKSGDTYLLTNGESRVQTSSSQLQGRVLLTLPFVGHLFGG